VFEANLRVLNYLKRNFCATYDLHLFSEEKAFLRDLEKTERPSLVLLAWDGISRSMPLFTALRAARPEVPVLVLATRADMADYEVFARHGVSGVVLKPFVDDALEVAIAKHLLAPAQDGVEPKEIALENGQFFEIGLHGASVGPQHAARHADHGNRVVVFIHGRGVHVAAPQFGCSNG